MQTQPQIHTYIHIDISLPISKCKTFFFFLFNNTIIIVKDRLDPGDSICHIHNR